MISVENLDVIPDHSLFLPTYVQSGAKSYSRPCVKSVSCSPSCLPPSSPITILSHQNPHHPPAKSLVAFLPSGHFFTKPSLISFKFSSSLAFLPCSNFHFFILIISPNESQVDHELN